MKVALILAIREKFGNPFAALGLGYVAASVRAKLPDVEISIKERLEDVIAEGPELVGISSASENYAVAIEYARKIKDALNVPIVVGGVHISMLPVSLDESFDVGVVGEGEKTFVELLQSIIANGGIRQEALASIPGLCFKGGDGKIHRTAGREIERDLDSLPRPQLEELPFFHNTPGATCIVSSRGCPYHCTFCISEKFHQKYRSLSPERIVDDIEGLVVRKGFKHVTFYDDLLIANKKKLLSLIALLRERGLKGKVAFSCAVRANLIDEEMCILLKALGVTGVGMGAESFSDRVLAYYNKTAVTGATNQQAIDLLHAYGIVVNPSFILAAPIETREDMLTTLRQIYKNFREGKICEPTWSPLIPYPGTEIWNHALQRGIVSEQMDWDKYQYHFHLCAEVPQEEFQHLMAEWLVKYTLLLAHQPSKGGSFVIRERPVLLQLIERLRRELADRPAPEMGDNLILKFRPSDLPREGVDDKPSQAKAVKTATGDPAIDALLARVAERNDSIRALTARVAGWDRSAANQLADGEQVVRALSTRLAQIGRSRAWKAAQLLQRIRVAIAPPESRRARFLRRAANVALVPYRATQRKRKPSEPAPAQRASCGGTSSQSAAADRSECSGEGSKSSDLAAPPQYLLIQLTKRCNYRCFFCCVPKLPAGATQVRDVPIEKFFSLQPAIETAGLIDLTSSGETLLYPHVREAFAFVAKHNRHQGFQFTTTGALLTEELIQPVASRIKDITVSLNASTAETYRRDMGSDLWERVLSNITCVRRLLSRDRISLSFVAHGENIDELPDFVRLAAKLDVWHIRIVPYRVNKPQYIGRSLWFCKEKSRDLIAEARAVGEKHDVVVSDMYESVQKLSSNKRQKCIMPTWGAYIETNGTVLPCCHSGEKFMGNVYEAGGFEKVWNGPKYQALRKRLYFPECQTCPSLRGQDMEQLDSHIEVDSGSLTMLPRVFVAIQTPANGEQLCSAVSSLKHQTYPLWEAVVMVDEDGDPSVVHAAHDEARKDSRIRCASTGSDADGFQAAKIVEREGGLFCRMDPAHPFKANDLEIHLKASRGLGAVAAANAGE
jgi:anaerobic magnesium-protoporphyrin IX monomethyl ester cyclase